MFSPIRGSYNKIRRNYGKRAGIIASIFWKWIMAPVVGFIIGVMVISRITDWFVGPESYKVFLVGGRDDRVNSQLWNAFKPGDLDIDGVKIKIETRSSDEDGAAELSEKLAKRDDTLMIVGHLYSTSSKNALPAYLKAEPPIPVILPTETNPEIFLPSSDTYLPVFRLSPSDDRQATKAADFIVKRGAKAIWVVEDESNESYSHYLAKQFVNAIHGKKASKVLLWTTTRSSPSTDTLKKLGIDGVFFAGYWPEGIILTRHVRTALKNDSITIILSDWCAETLLVDQGGADMKDVYLTNPISASEFYVGGYAHWGELAGQTLQHLVLGTKDRFNELAARNGGVSYYLNRVLNIHRVSDARNALRALMEEHVLYEKPFILNEHEYVFKHNGFLNDAEIHIWRIDVKDGKGRFTDFE